MYGNTPLSTLFGALGTAPTTLDSAYAYGSALMKHGLPVLLVNPDSKVPADWRSATERKKDQAADVRGGVHLATTKATTLKKYLKRAYAAPEDVKRGHPAPLGEGQVMNWAVRLRGSGYVVADADTPEEVAALRAFLAPDYNGTAPAPTVVTPGTLDGAHSGGGHWWFRLPDDLAEALTPALGLPATVKVHADGHDTPFSLYMGDAYVLIPPSVRDGKGYQLTAPDTQLPPALEEHIRGRLDVAKSRRVAREQREAELEERGDVPTSDLSLDDQITQWARNTPWTDILRPHGWVDTGVPDSCGCRVWTAPGSHGSPKSATTHSDVCSAGRYSLHNAPMHIWTDNPGPELEAAVEQYGTKTLSKLRVVAALDHDGDQAAAMAEAGIETAMGTPLDMTLAAVGAGSVDSAVEVTGAAPVAQVDMSVLAPTPATVPDAPEGAEVLSDLVADADTPVPLTLTGMDPYAAWGTERPTDDTQFRGHFRMAPASQYAGMEPPQWLVDGLLEHGLCSIVGDSGVGKSAVVLDMLCHMAMGWAWRGRKTRQCVSVYAAGESIHGAYDRLNTWAKVHEAPEVLDRVILVSGTPQVSGDREWWGKLTEGVLRTGAQVVVIDTLARATVGLEENAAKDMGVVNGVFDKVIRDTGASLWYVHHVTRGTSHGRGSTALYGAVDSEILISDLAEDGDCWDQLNGTPAAYQSDGTPVALEGKPLTVLANKEKNGPDVGVWTQVMLTSVSTGEDDTRTHALITELDAMPRHLFAGGEVLTSRRKGNGPKAEVDAEQWTGPAVDRDQDVVERLADMVEAVVDAAPSQDARYARSDLSTMGSFRDYRRDLQLQGWTGSWPEHVQAGMDLAVSRRTNDVGRPTKATIGYVDRYDHD